MSLIRAFAPVYNTTDDSPVRSRGRFSRLRWLKTRRTTCLSALAYSAVADSSMLPLMLRSFLPSVSRGLVYINTLGRTCLHELFIGYEQVTAWVARFSFKLETNYHQPPFALDGSMGRHTSRRPLLF